MKEYIVKDMTGEFEDKDYPELIRCKDCKFYEDHKRKIYENCTWNNHIIPRSPVDFCSNAERKDEYVTLHHDDIHFIDEDAERAFYEALTERRKDETD